MISQSWTIPHWRVLCYHGIEASQKEAFRRQLSTLLELGLRPTSFEAAMGACQTGPLLLPMLTVTFDDGAASIYEHALPILESLGIPAFLFATPDYMEKRTCYRDEIAPPAMSWDHLRDWRKRGHGVGSHTLTHANLRQCGPDERMRELRDSKALLEDRLQEPIAHFSYPWGQHSRESYQDIRSSRLYASAATIDRGQMHSGHDPFLLRRDVCDPVMPLDLILRRMRLADNPTYRFLTRVRRIFLTAAK